MRYRMQALISYEKWGQLQEKEKYAGMDDADPCESDAKGECGHGFVKRMISKIF